MNFKKNKMSVLANSLGLASMLVPTAIHLSDKLTGTNTILQFVAAVSSSSFTAFMLIYWIVRNWCVNVSSNGAKESFLYLTFIVLCMTGLFTCIGEVFLYGLYNSNVNILKVFATFSSVSYIRFKSLGLLPRPVYRCSSIGKIISIGAIVMITSAIAFHAKTGNALVVSWSFVLSGIALVLLSLWEETIPSETRDLWDISKAQLQAIDFIQLILFTLAYYWPDRSKF
ncbi:uncharacterized protein Eint_090030 [Encephalitozoon intestinalis ATCC 50506]|uniref:Uncharacterized protein n=1 Tax=Encephalitozoon intestinalis (strain ATCC 50506) TaxID=876142 RepID=E0S916_ENCIT|nr:uncharacterized protein Eint_090030 [Encephalitozoon intestinalis ATCC 50506]ADM12133.1 hypothetical protein Eint_090030 [Encephalitozoon intestinalis ATCC 50506]UTX45934.1 hypothetical protein GPK93_09g15190 [Encephalitozoon intestinalis]